MIHRLPHPAQLFPLVAVVVMSIAGLIGGGHDRAMLSLFVRTMAATPHFIDRVADEDGVRWRLLSMPSMGGLDRMGAVEGDLVLVSLGDNTEGVFQGSPHTPIDFALIFRNMQRLGGGSVAVGTVLAWDAPDAIGLVAVERALAEFDSVLTSAPLARGATSEPMPPAFRRASLPLDSLKGDVSALPVVNRQALASPLLGGENALAGFSFVEPLEADKTDLLIARWGDRAVFSFPFLFALQSLEIGMDDLDIRLGSHIRGSGGDWILPIDARGNLATRLAPPRQLRETSAELLFDADAETWEPASMWMLRDDRNAIEYAFRLHSERLVPRLQAAVNGAGFAESKVIHTVSRWQSWLFAIAVIIVLAGLGGLDRKAMQIGLATAFVGLVLLQWMALAMASLWMPAMPALLAVNVCWVLTYPAMQWWKSGRWAEMMPRLLKVRAGTSRIC